MVRTGEEEPSGLVAEEWGSHGGATSTKNMSRRARPNWGSQKTEASRGKGTSRDIGLKILAYWSDVWFDQGLALRVENSEDLDKGRGPTPPAMTHTMNFSNATSEEEEALTKFEPTRSTSTKSGEEG